MSSIYNWLACSRADASRVRFCRTSWFWTFCMNIPLKCVSSKLLLWLAQSSHQKLQPIVVGRSLYWYTLTVNNLFESIKCTVGRNLKRFLYTSSYLVCPQLNTYPIITLILWAKREFVFQSTPNLLFKLSRYLGPKGPHLWQ